MLLQATFFVGCMANVLAVCFKSELNLWFRCVHVSPPSPPVPSLTPLPTNASSCAWYALWELFPIPQCLFKGLSSCSGLTPYLHGVEKFIFCVWNDKFLLLCGSFGVVCPMLLTMCLKVLIHLLTNFFLLHRQICVVNSGTK